MIQDEKIPESGGGFEDRGLLCKAVVEEAKAGEIEIVTSALCLVEVCKNRDIADHDPKKLADFFENDYVLLVGIDKTIGERARELMMAGFSKLKPPDACHLATAAIAPSVTELHTFDDKLLALDSRIEKSDKTMLRVCKPNVGERVGSLFDVPGP